MSVTNSRQTCRVSITGGRDAVLAGAHFRTARRLKAGVCGLNKQSRVWRRGDVE